METEKKELFDEYLKLEKEGIEVLKKIGKRKANKTQAGKNNYTFNNCTVTINEEGKDIDILQKKEQFNNMAMEQGMKMVGNVIDLYAKKATTASPQPPPAKEWAKGFVKAANKQKVAAKKKAPVKKKKSDKRLGNLKAKISRQG